MKLSMLKLSASTILLSSTLLASSATKVENFLENNFRQNPNVQGVVVKVVSQKPLKELKGWSSLILSVDATVKIQGTPRHIKQKMVWFSNGKYLTKDLIDLDTGATLADGVAPEFKAEYYSKANLIYGNANAKHKVAIFSDPLCPFCKRFVPGAIEEMKKSPEMFAIYYYHLPLESLHPAAKTLVEAAVALELQGQKNVILDLYKVKISSRERDQKKILKAFNKTFGSNITVSDIQKPAVQEHVKRDAQIAEDLMVQGTPTVFFDGKIDKTKQKYKEAK